MGQGIERLPAKWQGFFSRAIQSGSLSEIMARTTGESHTKASNFVSKVSGVSAEVRRDAVSTPNSTMGSAKMCAVFMNNSLQDGAPVKMPIVAGTTAAGAVAALMLRVSLGNSCWPREVKTTMIQSHLIESEVFPGLHPSRIPVHGTLDFSFINEILHRMFSFCDSI